MARPKSSEYHHGNLKEAILRTSLKIVAEKGATSLTLRAVAQKIGVSHMACYRHFADKNALLQALAEEGFRKFSEALEAVNEKKQTNAKERLTLLGYCYVMFALENKQHFQLMWDKDIQSHKSEGVCKESERAFSALLLASESFLKQSKSKMDTQSCALEAWIYVHGIANLMLSGQIPASFVNAGLKKSLHNFVERLER